MMNLLLCGNDRVYPGMELVVYSALTHNTGIHFYVFTMDIALTRDDGGIVSFTGLGRWHKNKLQKIVQILDRNSRITFVDTHDLYMEHFLGNPNEFSWLTPYAPLRLLADIALPHIGHVLYLDCDTAVLGDISQMYQDYLRMGHNYYAYVNPDACGGDGEMVSGVMLMDLSRMRESGFLKHARENVNRNKYPWYDQCAIRDAGKPYPLPETYSYMEDYDSCGCRPRILHFTNNLSPKIYQEGVSREYFYRKFNFLRYVKEGVERLDDINWGGEGDGEN